MDSWWKSVSEAADKATAMAKEVSKKGLELAEATAEEAGKKFKDLNISQALTAPIPQQKAPTQAELEAYGITPSFVDFIRSLNFNSFRDYQEGPKPTEAPASGDAAPSAPTLNTWQLRHATLVVRAVKEVNELRYVLCPRYMDDQKFWSIYFMLTQGRLPTAAKMWKDGDPLPPIGESREGDDQFMSFAGLQGQLKQLSSKIQAAANSAAQKARVTAPGLELTTFIGGQSKLQNESTAPPVSSSSAHIPSDAITAPIEDPGAMLEADPDLEAYLRDVDHQPSDGEAGGRIETVDGEEEEVDLDTYLNELSAEVIEDDAEEGGLDVDAVLKELQEEGEIGVGQDGSAGADESSKDG